VAYPGMRSKVPHSMSRREESFATKEYRYLMTSIEEMRRSWYEFLLLSRSRICRDRELVRNGEGVMQIRSQETALARHDPALRRLLSLPGEMGRPPRDERARVINAMPAGNDGLADRVRNKSQ